MIIKAFHENRSAVPLKNSLQLIAFAVACVAVATLIRYLLEPFLGNAAPWILYYPATALAAWYAGLRGGIAATVVSILAALYFWIEPIFSFSIPDIRTAVTISVFAISSVFISYLAELWHSSERNLKSAKAKIEKQAADLEQTVQERTSRLRESVAELEAFSYTVSHDLKGPIRALQGFSQYVIEESGEKLDQTSKDYLNRIVKAAHRMDRLINDVLLYSRTSGADVPNASVNLDEMVDDIRKDYAQLHQPNVEITVDQPLGWVLANPSLLMQCLSNLMTNAAKFVEPGATAKIRIYSEREGTSLRIIVQDNGIGIPNTLLGKIFGIFERVHTERDYQGTGIGLAIVKKAVDRMNGEIGVESELGKGSTFWIKLPALEDQTSTSCSQEASH